MSGKQPTDAGPDPDRERLIKLLGRLGSDNEHERAVAGARITEHLRRMRLTWYDLINGGGYEAGYEKGFREAAEAAFAVNNKLHEEIKELRSRGATWQQIATPGDTALFCLESKCKWTEWEYKFLTDMIGRSTTTHAQQEKLDGLSRKASYFNNRPSPYTQRKHT